MPQNYWKSIDVRFKEWDTSISMVYFILCTYIERKSIWMYLYRILELFIPNALNLTKEWNNISIFVIFHSVAITRK